MFCFFKVNVPNTDPLIYLKSFCPLLLTVFLWEFNDRNYANVQNVNLTSSSVQEVLDIRLLFDGENYNNKSNCRKF